MSEYLSIAGAPFLALRHHDGRMIRSGGLFVFARRAGARRTILNMELAEMISQRATPGHPRWELALANGMNELLVCLAAAPMALSEDDVDVVWHEEAECWPPQATADWSPRLEAAVARLTGSG